MRPGLSLPVGRNALVGRDAEAGRLAAAVSAAQAGRGRIVLISGEPGIGKTALLAAVRDLAAAAPTRVVSGAAEELEMRIPFAAISDCLGLAGSSADPEVAGIAALIRGAGRSGNGTAADTEFLVTEAILAMLDGWCTAGPVVLALDDLQWADPASVLVLHRLGRIAGQLPLLLAAACRSGAGGPDLEPLIRSWEARGAETIRLGPLDDASVVTLTGQVLGSATQAPPSLREAMRAAAGNPLYVIELARALAAGQPRTGEAVPESLIAVVTRRLSGLSRQAHQILQVAAVLGPNFTVAELATVLSAPAIELLGVIQEAAAAGVLAAESDRLAFRHEIIRQALYESLPVSARNALHLQAGQALAAAGAPVERAAQHLLAGTTLDARTLDWLVASAERLSARAPELAADLLSRVSDLAEPSGHQAGPLRLALASALLRAGRFAQAETVAAEALAADQDGPHSGQLRWVLALSYLNQGRAADALAEAQRALADGKLGRVEQARFHGLAAQCLHLVSSPDPDHAMRESEAARGIRQFIDVGAGLPTALNTHQIARRVNPQARVAYVDNDPIVISHARNLLAKSPGVIAVPGDMRDPGRVLADAGLADLIDLTEPTCVIMSGVLHFAEAGTARDVAAAFARAIAPGGYVVISVGFGNPSEAQTFTSTYTAAPIYVHSQEEILGFFDGLELVPPGVVPVRYWNGDRPDAEPGRATFLGGVALKP